MPKTNIDIYTELHGSRAKVKGLEKNLKTMEGRARSSGTSLSGLWKQVAIGMGLTMGIPALIRGVKNLASSFLGVSIELEQYTIRLKTLLGSQEAASKAMGHFQDIASKLPFTLDEVIESGIRLTTIKVPFKDWLIPIADVAAAFGLDLPTATDQFSRAMSAGLGAADWFREKGISAMIRDFAKLKYGIDDLSKAGTAKLKEVMYEWAKTFEGSSEEMSKTWSGTISMIQDAWFQFRSTIMEAGIFDALKEGLQDVLEWIKRMQEEGKIEEWAAIAEQAFKDVTTAVGFVYKGLKLLGELKPSRLYEETDKETKAYKSLHEEVGLWTDFQDKAVRAEIMGKEELMAIWDKYEQNTKDTYAAIALGVESEALQEFLLNLAGRHMKAFEAAIKQKEGLEELGEVIERLTKKESEQFKTVKEGANAIKEIAIDYDKLFDSIDTTELDLEWQGFIITFKEAQEEYRKQLLESLGIHQEATGDMGDQVKELSDFEQMALAEMMSSYQGIIGTILSVIEKWAIGEIVKSVMTALPFPINLLATAGAITAVKAIFAGIKGMKEGGIIPEEGIYHLHKGEYVTPANQVTNVYNQLTNNVQAIQFHQTIQIGTERIADEVITVLKDRAERGTFTLPLKVIQ